MPDTQPPKVTSAFSSTEPPRPASVEIRVQDSDGAGMREALPGDVPARFLEALVDWAQRGLGPKVTEVMARRALNARQLVTVQMAHDEARQVIDAIRARYIANGEYPKALDVLDDVAQGLGVNS